MQLNSSTQPPKTSALRDKFDFDFSELHASVYPAEIRDYDRVAARIRPRAPATDFKDVRVWRLSPLGIELVCDEADPVLRKFNKIDLELTIAGQRAIFEGLVVDVVKQNEHITLAGVRLSQSEARTAADKDQRRSKRWLCGEEFYPTCVSPTPGRFNEYMYFQIRDISREGLQLLCSLRNKYLIPGTDLKLTASFPMVGDLSLSVKITRVGITSERDKDYLVIGTEYSDLSKSARNIIGQYLLQFGNADSLAELRSAGYFPQSIAKGTDFYFLKTEEDYEEVLKLRLMAHQVGGTIGRDATIDDVSDQFDSNSRIIVGKHKGRIIATARVHFSALEEKMEHEQYIDWPPDYPRRDTIFEVTRACTHPDFRSNDLVAALQRFIAITSIQPQRPWVLMSSTEALLPFYQKVGYVTTPFQYEHPFYKGRQHVILTNALEMISGRSAHPIYWNAIWWDVYQHLTETGILRPEPIDHARVRIYRLLQPLSSVFAGVSRRPRRKP